MTKWFRPHNAHAPWQGFFVAHLMWKGVECPNKWGWTTKGFMFPWSAIKFAKERVESPEISHASIFFHPHPWMAARRYRVVGKDGIVKKHFGTPMEEEPHV